MGSDDHPYGRMRLLYGVAKQMYDILPDAPTFRDFLEALSSNPGQMGADAREIFEELCIGCKRDLAEIKGSYCMGCIQAADWRYM